MQPSITILRELLRLAEQSPCRDEDWAKQTLQAARVHLALGSAEGRAKARRSLGFLPWWKAVDAVIGGRESTYGEARLVYDTGKSPEEAARLILATRALSSAASLEEERA